MINNPGQIKPALWGIVVAILPINNFTGHVLLSEVLLCPNPTSERRHGAVGRKVRLIETCMALSKSLSLVARTYGVVQNFLDSWKKQMSESGKTAIEANDEVISGAGVKPKKS